MKSLVISMMALRIVEGVINNERKKGLEERININGEGQKIHKNLLSHRGKSICFDVWQIQKRLKR